MTARPRVRLVLGGGGGKGIVHIGVIKAVIDLGFAIESITGTSIGAIWGALYGRMLALTSGSLDERQHQAIDALEKTAYALTLRNFRDFNWRSLLTRGLLKGRRLESWLESMLWPHSAASAGPLTFSQLDFDLTITATDAITGSPLAFNRLATPGLAIARAVRASMSIPFFFMNVDLEIPDNTGGVRTVQCWDGGTTGNCRFDLSARQLPLLPVIASSLTYRGEPVMIARGPLTFYLRIKDTYDQTVNHLLRQSEQQLLDALAARKPGILLLRPPLSGISTFALDLDGDTKSRAIEAAYRYTRETIAATGGMWLCSHE